MERDNNPNKTRFLIKINETLLDLLENLID